MVQRRRHVIISGTGRAGTTFLMQLLTELGLDTGFRDPDSGVFAHCNAGMELDILKPNAPYIIKDPMLCLRLDGILENVDIEIDHAFVPIRDIRSAAESRRYIERSFRSEVDSSLAIPGGLTLTHVPEEQESKLTEMLYRLVFTLVDWDIPVTLLQFPRLVHDPDYLYSKMHIFLSRQGISRARFQKGFDAIARPELVHDFAGQGLPDLQKSRAG